MARSISDDVSVLMNGNEAPCTPRDLSPASVQCLERRISNQTVPSHLGTVIDLHAQIRSKRG